MVRMIMMAGAALALVTVMLGSPATADEAALRHRLKVLEATPAGGTPEKGVLREIGALMQGLQAKPIPEEFHRRMARGESALGAARDMGGFKRAADEYRAATRVAPWRADAYYNLGIVQDKAGLYDAAMRNLKIYLAANPDAADAAAVRKRVYQIEYRKEQAQAGRTKAVEAKAAAEQERRRQQQAKQKANEERRRIERRVASFLGQWDLRCGRRSTAIKLTPAGPLAVKFYMWASRLNPPSWGGQTNLKFDSSANKFVSNRSGNSLELAVVDDNQLRYTAISPVGTYICPVYRK